MSKEKLPTAEEILHKHFKPLDPFDNICILNAMSVHTAPLQARIEELEAWKESAMKTLNDVNLQECGKLLNVGLGQNIAVNIVPKIKELKAENERLKEEMELWFSSDKDANIYLGKLQSQNARLREALEWYANSDNYLTDDETLATAWSKNKNIEKKAKEALKGCQDE